MQLRNVIIDIEKLNENDSIEELANNTGLDVFDSLSNFVLAEQNSSDLDYSCSFVITDNRSSADYALKSGIGIAVYINDSNSASDFPEALYCVDSLKEMERNTLVRMYERANDIPWTILATERCVVMEMTVDDVDRLYEIYADSETSRYIEDLYRDKEDEKEYTIKYINNQYKFFEYGIWIVKDKNDGVIIGRAGLFNRDNQDEIELGFVFDRKYWGRGIASEVLLAIISYAKEELSVTEIVAHAHIDNIRSKKILEKLGFELVKNTEIDSKPYVQYRAYL